MSKDFVKADKLIPFLNAKYKVDLKYNKESVIERKEMILNKVESLNEEEGTIVCTITTQDTDRNGDVVLAGGCDSTEFVKIPSVFLNHNHAANPIATCEELIHQNDSIMAKVKFVLSVGYIRDIFELVKAGALRGVSIGFDPKDVILRGTRAFDDTCKAFGLNKEKTRRIIKSWLLYEFSIVSLPCNASCHIKSLTDANMPVSPELEKILGKIEAKQQEIKIEVTPVVEEVPIAPLIAPQPAEVKEETNPEEVVNPAHEATEIQEEENEEHKEEIDEVAEVADKAKKYDEFLAYGKRLPKEEVDAEEYKLGVEYEKEHTDNEEIVEKIVLDHLTENPRYYSMLGKLEAESKEEPKPELPSQPEPKRYIKVLKTNEGKDWYVKKMAEARLNGRAVVYLDS